jgi:hypothetical protein
MPIAKIHISLKEGRHGSTSSIPGTLTSWRTSATSYLIRKEYATARRYATEARSLAPDDLLIQPLGAMTEQAAPSADW